MPASVHNMHLQINISLVAVVSYSFFYNMFFPSNDDAGMLMQSLITHGRYGLLKSA